MSTITIDGVEVPFTEGQTVMQAADAAGVYIPRLCYHKDLMPAGHCRMCTCKINGRPGSTCTHPAGAGMTVECNTDELNAHRVQLLELLFVEGNHNCPACEMAGDCELQALAYRLGMLAPTLQYQNPHRAIDASHPDIFIDRSRCVLCSRCIRASRDADGKTALGFEGRGIHKILSVDAVDGLSETQIAATDKAAEICPVGCLRVKGKGFSTPYGQRAYDVLPIGSDIESNASA